MLLPANCRNSLLGVLGLLLLSVSSLPSKLRETSSTPQATYSLLTNRVIEVNPLNHSIVWHFGNGSSTAGPHSIVGTNDAQRVGSFTLIAGTGVPAGTFEPTCPNGCPDNRVILVNEAGEIVWQYGKAGVSGSGPDELNTPVQNPWLPNFHVLITDQANERIIEVRLDKKIVWQYGMTGVTGCGFNQLNNPNSAELLANGHTNTRPGSCNLPNTCPLPTRAVRLRNGNNLISDQFNMQVIEINPLKKIVFSQGQIGVSGTGFNQLNAPYDAKAVGDYTGLTPPFGPFE
jgi:hypothetical protein